MVRLTGFRFSEQSLVYDSACFFFAHRPVLVSVNCCVDGVHVLLGFPQTCLVVHAVSPFAVVGADSTWCGSVGIESYRNTVCGEGASMGRHSARKKTFSLGKVLRKIAGTALCGVGLFFVAIAVYGLFHLGQEGAFGGMLLSAFVAIVALFLAMIFLFWDDAQGAPRTSDPNARTDVDNEEQRLRAEKGRWDGVARPGESVAEKRSGQSAFRDDGTTEIGISDLKVQTDSSGFPLSYVSLDFETTGLHPEYDRIVEFGAVKVSNGHVVDRFQQLVNPGRPIPGKVVSLTGITDDMVSGCPSVSESLPRFLEWVSDSVVIGHNVEFDLGFIEAESQRCGIPEPHFVTYDTMQISRAFFPEESRHRLADLVRRFGIDDNEEHRALSDATQTYRCFEWMRRYVTNSGIKTKSVVDAAENGNTAQQTVYNSSKDYYRSKYYGDQRPKPKNTKPEGTEILNACGCEIVGEDQHQEALAKYGIDSWLWVTLRRGSIPKGKNAGQPTIIVNVDGEDVGWTTPLNTSKHYTQIPQSGCVSKGRIKKAVKSERLDLRIYLPEPESPSMEYGLALAQSQNGKQVKESDGITPRNQMPHKKDLTGPIPIDVLLNNDAEDTFSEYDDGDWLWVLIRNDKTEAPTVLVNLSRKRLGVLSVDDSLRYHEEIGESGAMCKAKITKNDTGTKLTVMLPNVQ